jgi:Flp pilus assembly protein TadD
MRISTVPRLSILMGAVLALVAGCQLGTKPGDSSLGMATTPRDLDPAGKPSGDKRALDVQLALAQTLEQQHDSERAATVYRKIIQHSPKCGPAYHRLAIIEDQARRFDESGPLFQKALKLQPHKAEIFCDLGYSQYLQRRWSDAETNLRQSLVLQPDMKRAHNHLGMLLVQMDRRDEALTEFRRAGCTLVQAHMNCAVALVSNDRLAEAREEYEVARAAGPVPKELETRLAQLGRLVAVRDGDADAASGIQLTSGEGSGTARISRR